MRIIGMYGIPHDENSLEDNLFDKAEEQTKNPFL